MRHSSPELDDAPGIITNRQTTRWDLQFDKGTKLRVHFEGKMESQFQSSRFENAMVYSQHPLLVEYLEPWVELSFKGIPPDPQAVAAAVEAMVEGMSQGWRASRRYVNAQLPFDDLLRAGGGVLWVGPASYGMAAASILQQAGVWVGKQARTRVAVKPEVLVLDRSYVVANSFRIEPWPGTVAL